LQVKLKSYQVNLTITKGDIIQQHNDTVSAMRAISPFVIFAVFDVQVLKCCH